MKLVTDKEFLQVLRHDLHKIEAPGALAHGAAIPDDAAREVDGVAAWLSRNFLREPFMDKLYRKSLIFPMRNLENPRALINQHKAEVAELFEESDAVQLHEFVLTSKLLNFFSEAGHYPYTSLKYHILLTCALYFNLTQNYKLNELYLCENSPVTSPFQVIYIDGARTWAILPKRREDGLTRVQARFCTSWDRRRELIFGGDYRILGGFLSSIGSWSTALAVIEDFQELVDCC